MLLTALSENCLNFYIRLNVLRQSLKMSVFCGVYVRCEANSKYVIKFQFLLKK